MLMLKQGNMGNLPSGKLLQNYGKSPYAIDG